MPVNRDNVKKTLENNTRFLEYTEKKTDPKMPFMITKPGSKAKKPPKILNPELATNIIDGVVAGKTMVSISEKSIITTDTYGLAGSLCFILNKMFEKGIINEDKYNIIYRFLKQYFDPNVLTRRGDNIDATIRDYKTLLSSIGFYDGEITATPKAAATPRASSSPKAVATPRASSSPKAAASPRASPPRETASKTGKMATSSSSGSDKPNKTRRKRVKSEEAKSQEEEAKPQEQKSRKRNKPQ
jgi:hypothetical protein